MDELIEKRRALEADIERGLERGEFELVYQPKADLHSGRVSGVECVIVDELGAAVPPGEQGELLVSAPTLMAGYWNLPAETAHVMTADGYFRTGDKGERRADGLLKLKPQNLLLNLPLARSI